MQKSRIYRTPYILQLLHSVLSVKKSTQKNSSKQREEFCDFLSESKQTVVKISVKDTV